MIRMWCSNRRVAARTLLVGPVVLAIAFAILVAAPGLVAQRGGGPAGPPQTARQRAPADLTGTWVSVVTEDWRWRMATPPVGDVASMPVNAAGRAAAKSWNLAADNAGGNQCKAFGVGGIVRQPGRIRISWQDDQTLTLEFDAGTQTRLLHFDPAATPSAETTWQGHSFAVWDGPGVGRGAPPVGDPRVTGGGVLAPAVPGGGGRGLRGGPPPRQQAQINRGGHIRVVTTNFREGYLRKNGVPYSENAVLTEYWEVFTRENGEQWLTITTMIDDPRYLRQPRIVAIPFKKEPDGAKWDPTPCSARW
jgi:hypothetical protein